MILSDTQILKKVKDNSLGISKFDSHNLNPCSYDLTLADSISEYTASILDVSKEQNIITRKIGISGVILSPGKVYLAHCNEELKIPRDLRGVLCGKSSLGRLGLLIHLTAGFIDPGFEGSLVLELACFQPIRIYPNIPIAQIEFSEVYNDMTEDYGQKKKSKYHKQKGSQKSLYYLNLEK